MSNFWDKLYNPIPLYTEENVGDTIAYVDERHKHQHLPFVRVFKTALTYVQSQLTNSPIEYVENDIRVLSAAVDSAEELRERAVQAKDFVSVVRWRYVAAALSDYRRYLILKKEAVT